MTVKKDEAYRRREAEIKRGQEIGARAFLKQAFDPEYRPNSGIDPATRARRDAYREHLPNGKHYRST